jgi:hypothetical protein
LISSDYAETGPNPFNVIFSGRPLDAQTPSGGNVNCDEKQLTGKKFELFLLSVQVS